MNNLVHNKLVFHVNTLAPIESDLIWFNPGQEVLEEIIFSLFVNLMSCNIHSCVPSGCNQRIPENIITQYLID